VPEFLVVFGGLVTYQPDHPKMRRSINGLCVNAPTSTAAMQHALRTTRGDAEVTEVVPIEQANADHVAAAKSLLPYLPAVVAGA
jgi:hypothetical protein